MIPFLGGGSAGAALPYAARTLPYNGYHAVIHGDLQMVGMSGALAGLPDSVMESIENPSAMSMMVPGLQLQAVSNVFFDSQMGPIGSSVPTSQAFALGAPLGPWALGITKWNPSNEIQNVAEDGTNPAYTLEVVTREVAISGSRMLFNNKLGLGLSLIVGEGYESLSTAAVGQSSSQSAVNVGFSLGGIYQFKKRFFLGASYQPGLNYNFVENAGTPLLPGFFEDVKTPERFSLGVGWLPSRFFRAGVAVHWIGAVSNTALLSDQSRRVGEYACLQPRIGVNYTFFELRNVRAKLSAGSYLEPTRVGGAGSRFHVTAGLQADLWVFNIGYGGDFAQGFSNSTYYFGTDLVKVAQKLRLIPPAPVFPYGGFMPDYSQYSDDDLPDPIRARPLGPRGNPEDEIREIGEALPGRIEEQILNPIEPIGNLTDDIADTVKSWRKDIPKEIKKIQDKAKAAKKKNAKNKKKKKNPDRATERDR